MIELSSSYFFPQPQWILPYPLQALTRHHGTAIHWKVPSEMKRLCVKWWQGLEGWKPAETDWEELQQTLGSQDRSGGGWGVGGSLQTTFTAINMEVII